MRRVGREVYNLLLGMFKAGLIFDHAAALYIRRNSDKHCIIPRLEFHSEIMIRH